MSSDTHALGFVRSSVTHEIMTRPIITLNKRGQTFFLLVLQLCTAILLFDDSLGIIVWTFALGAEPVVLPTHQMKMIIVA